MNWGYFSTRELALIIWCGIAIILMSFHNEIRCSIISLLKAFIAWKLLLMLGVLTVIFVMEILAIINIANIKDLLSIKDVAIWFLFAGLPMACSASSNLTKDESYFRNFLLDNLKFIVVVEFIINYYTFSIWIEIFVIPIILFFVLLETVNDLKIKDTNVTKVINCIIFFGGLFLIIFTSKSLIYDYPKWINIENLVSLSLPFLLSIIYIPVAYFAALIMTYETMYLRVSWMQSECSRKELQKRKWLIFCACKFSWKKLNVFEKYYVHRLYPSMPQEEFFNELNDFTGKRLYMKEFDDFCRSDREE